MERKVDRETQTERKTVVREAPAGPGDLLLFSHQCCCVTLQKAGSIPTRDKLVGVL